MVVLVIAAVVTLLTVAGNQVANGAQDLADSVSEGVAQITDWLKNGPLHASDSQINDYLDRAQEAISNFAQDGEILQPPLGGRRAVGHVLAGFFIVLFSTYFFLADGERIWAWFVRLSPRASRVLVDGSGRVAWVSLTQFVRATVIVAATDAIGVMIVAAILGVPFVMAIGVLVFLGAFVPMVGAFVAGTVAVLVALVDQGPVTALLMLGGVDPGPADRGPRPPAVPDGPLRLRAPARRDRRDRRRRDRRRHPGCAGRRARWPRPSTPSPSTWRRTPDRGTIRRDELEKDYAADGEQPPAEEPGDEPPPEPEDRDPSYGNRRGTDPAASPDEGGPRDRRP